MVIVFTTVFSSSCQEKKVEPFVQYVMQPEIELGQTTDLYVYFKVKPDSVWADADHIGGLELTDGLKEVKSHINGSTVTDDKGKVVRANYNFFTYAKATRLGKIDFPGLNVMVKGKRYKTPPFSVTVVKQITISPDAVKIELSSDKKSYGLKDTVRISLYEYSKFSNASRKNTSSQPAIAGKGNEIKISTEQGPDEISGIGGFDKYLDAHFKLEDIDWDPTGSKKSIEIRNGVNYLKTLIFSVKLLPKHKGEFKIGPSEFNYEVYKNNADYFSGLTPNNNGTYNITDKGSTKLKVASQAIAFDVK